MIERILALITMLGAGFLTGLAIYYAMTGDALSTAYAGGAAVTAFGWGILTALYTR